MKIYITNPVLVNVSDLKRHPKNPNKHTKDQIERLAKILQYQGWRYPIKVSKQSGFITSGHARLEAAILNGWDQVPVSIQDYESEDQEFADLTSDNAISEWSQLDFYFINNHIENMSPDFDIDMLGIKNFTLDFSDKFNPDSSENLDQTVLKCKECGRSF